MRLSWKLFFITTPIFVVLLTVFGTWMIQDSFQTSLDKEIEHCMVENQMFQNSYELTRRSLSTEQQEQTSIRKLVESFYRKKGTNKGNARIYDMDGTVLYQDNDLKLETSIMETLNEEQNVGYEIVRSQDQTYVVVMVHSSFDDVIETTRNITQIFEERIDMYSRYQTGALLLTVLVGGLILLVLFLVMRNIQKLSRATRQFARGRYDIRVNIRSRDEVGMLAENFNWMANAMNIQMERLQNEVRRQEEFTAAFAHELKTPLTSIIGYADTIRQMELSKEDTDMCADYIFQQGKRLQALSHKLLEMTMAGNQEINFRSIMVSELFRELERTMKPVLEPGGLKLEIRFQEGFLYGDRDLLLSLFINLLDNARKFSPEDGTIWLSGETLPEGYLITVTDEGAGLPQEELSRITEAFYMVDKSRSRKAGGAGLGLALCQKIVELHQGSLQFSNQRGRGLQAAVRFGYPEQSRHRRRRELSRQ